MPQNQSWLLPEFLEDVLPPVAHAIEDLRRRLLDHFQSNGYALVMPPMLEHLSALGATGDDLELATFKVVDELSGHMLGLRADHTPQVTRIDAHLLNREGVTRLCYCGPVLHTRPAGLSKSREPLQIGAELYGFPGVEADIEIIRLVAQSLAMTGVAGLHIEVGHPGVFNALAQDAALSTQARRALFDAIESRDVVAIRAAVAGLPEATQALFADLPRLNGDAARLAQTQFSNAAAQTALGQLQQLLTTLEALREQLAIPVSFGFDLAELGGFHYEQGIVFAAYAPGLPDAIARGGRYDEVGEAFGRARPATGFTLDLKQLARLVPVVPAREPIYAPFGPDRDVANFYETVRVLRERGEVVLQCLPGEVAQLHGQKHREIAFDGIRWTVSTKP